MNLDKSPNALTKEDFDKLGYDTSQEPYVHRETSSLVYKNYIKDSIVEGSWYGYVFQKPHTYVIESKDDLKRAITDNDFHEKPSIIQLVR